MQLTKQQELLLSIFNPVLRAVKVLLPISFTILCIAVPVITITMSGSVVGYMPMDYGTAGVFLFVSSLGILGGLCCVYLIADLYCSQLNELKNRSN